MLAFLTIASPPSGAAAPALDLARHWPWLASAALLALLLGIVSWQRLRALSRRAAGSEHRVARIAAVLALPAAFGLPLLLLNFALAAAPWRGAWVSTLRHGLVLALVAVVTWTLVRAIAAVERRVLAHWSIAAADNLGARRVHTQTRVLARALMTLAVLVGAAAGLMTIPGLRQVGAGLLASAGVVGLVAGLAAQPILGNLIAGLQIALAQPIRIDDVVIVQGEWGRIEEITATYIVVAIWDERRLIVPLKWFIDNPFENWTRRTSQILGSVMLWLDYRTPLAPVRAEFERLCDASENWDGRVRVLQVVECGQWSMQVRLLVSAADSGKAFGLRCEVREGILDFLQAHHPESLPLLRTRAEGRGEGGPGGAHDEVANSRHESGWQPPVEAGANPVEGQDPPGRSPDLA